MASGWLCHRQSPKVTHIPSPHCDTRPEPLDLRLVVVHCISLPLGQYGTPYIADLFKGTLDCSAHPSFASLEGVRVSAHCVINRLGEVTQFVPFHQRAWHAGVSEYLGQSRCNDFSIGIELEGTDHTPYEACQYRVLSELIASLIKAYPSLSKEHIVGHSHIAPGRKTDPGPEFDFQLLHHRLNELLP